MDSLKDKFHQATRNRYLMLGFVSAHIQQNDIINLELRWSYNALPGELVLPSTSNRSNICRKEYSLTLDAIKQQLPSRNKVSLALDGCTSMKKLAIMSVITYYSRGHWVKRQRGLACPRVGIATKRLPTYTTTNH